MAGAARDRDLKPDHRPGASTLSARFGDELVWVEIRAPHERWQPCVAPFDPEYGRARDGVGLSTKFIAWPSKAPETVDA